MVAGSGRKDADPPINSCGGAGAACFGHVSARHLCGVLSASSGQGHLAMPTRAERA